MTNQTDSKDGIPRKEGGRPSPDVDREADGQAGASSDAGDGPGKIGLTSDDQPDLVAPSGVNERDRGAADDKPMGGGALNFNDDEIYSGRGNSARTGGTWDAQGGDSGRLGAPSAGLSDRNGPSDPDKAAEKPRGA